LNKNKELNKKLKNKTQGGVMKSYVNKTILLWSCCIIGFAFAVDQAAAVKVAPEVKMTTKKAVDSQQSFNNKETGIDIPSPVMKLSSEDAILAEKERHRANPLNLWI